MPLLDAATAHLLRRAGFGASADDVAVWGPLGINAAVNALVDFETTPDDVDDHLGDLGYLGTTSRGPFDPNNDIIDAMQRWLFRMVHTRRPLQEKMALFWHNHFATGYSKIAGKIGPAAATRAMAARPTGASGDVTGQIEVFRLFALGSFRNLLLLVSQDPAMIAWLDGETNIKDKPQENYARELMELFTVGVEFFTEEDVHAGARVFTGWNLRRNGFDREEASAEFFFNPRQHDEDAKTFSFPIYPDGTKTIPPRSGPGAAQDGVDLIDALVRHPETGPRLSRKLYTFFVNELSPPDETLVQELATTYYATDFSIRAMVRQLLLSPQFQDPSNRWARYAWPAEFVPRLIKEVGWTGFSSLAGVGSMVNMGQTLFEPPDVAGWSLGPDWFTTGTMLTRMNFAAFLAHNQRFALQSDAMGSAETPEAFLAHFLDRLSLPPLSAQVSDALLDYLRAGSGWTGSSSQVATKGAGLVHLLGASSEYQFV